MKNRFVLTLISIGLLAGCTVVADSAETFDAQSDPGTKALDSDGFLAALLAAGADATPSGSFSSLALTGDERLIRVNGEDLQVYEYGDAATAEREAAYISSDGGTINVPDPSNPDIREVSIVEWIATPHFYRSGRLIVQYIGDDRATIDVLTSILGPQFAGGSFPAATVQPPSMPNAQPTVTPRSSPSIVEESIPRVTADLPPLPALTGPAIGGETPYADQLAAATFTLNADLPTGPAAAPALLAPMPGDPTAERVLAFARRLGLQGELQVLLQPQYPDRFWLDPAHEDLPRQFLIFDGSRTVSGLYYSDLRPDAVNVQMPFARAVPVAERFLRSHGLLDFPYRVAPYSDSSFGVEFQQTVDGRPLLFPRISVGVDVSEQVYVIQYSQLTGLTKVNDYPLRSAHEAWQAIADGLATDEANFALHPAPSEEMPSEETVEMWTRPFQDGQTVELISFITLPHQSFSGDGEIRIPAGPFILEGPDEDLRAIAGEPLAHLWGTVRHDEAGVLRLELKKWKPFGFQAARDTTGVIEEQDGKILFRESGHDEIYLLQDAPVELAAGDAVRIEGWFTMPEDGSLPPFEWFNIWRYGPALFSDATVPYEPPTVRQVIIDAVSLAYLPAPNLISISLSGGPEQEYRLFQPVWLFSGRTDAGHLIELMAKAIND